MIRPLNCASRRLRSLVTEARSTVKAPAVTLVPDTVIEPEIEEVRPTAVLLWPNSTSFTRYPATDPLPTFHVPSAASPDRPETVAPPDAGVAPAVAVPAGELSASGGGADPSMKWMYTNGPPTTATATATTPIPSQRFQ